MTTTRTVPKPVPKATDLVIVGQLKALGFSDEYVEAPRRLVVSSGGREKTGKSHFGLTGPEPIVYFDIDIGTEGVVEKFQAEGKQILRYAVRVPREEKQDVYVPMWADLKSRIIKAYTLRVGTVVWDSVVADSPVLLKDKDGFVWVGSIEDFWSLEHERPVSITERNEQVLFLDQSSRGWRTLNSVWNQDRKERVNPWTPIKAIIRHYYKGKILRVTTSGGTLRVTPNHSLMQGSGASAGFVDAGKLEVGDVLSLPMYSRTPSNLCRHANGCSIFIGTADLAWLYGFFVAEGSAWDTHDSRYPEWKGINASFSNKDKSLIERSKRIAEETFHVPVDVRLDEGDVWKATIRDTGVAAYFKSMFYDSRREKIVPSTILNARPDIKRSFFEGYLAGDGHCSGRGGAWEFDTTSPSLAMALIWMERSSSVESKDITVRTRQDKPTVTRVLLPENARGPRGVIKSIVEEQYDGMVYDLETENHAFCVGVGGILAHNTATEAYELARLSRFGKLTQVMPHNYTEVNNEWRELLRTAYDSGMNTVFIHKMKPVWINNARTKDYEIAGFGEMDYLAQVNLVHYREDTDEGIVFSAYIKDCRQNPGVSGTTMRGLPLVSGESRTFDPLCNFDMLLSLVHGDK